MAHLLLQLLHRAPGSTGPSPLPSHGPASFPKGHSLPTSPIWRVPLQGAPSGSAEPLSTKSPFSGYAGAILPASFSGHKATDEPVTSGFAASALRLKHVKIPIEDPKT
ncbi:hypothetical protein IFM61392_03089 [Aspergillus lentulus]|nr:hypothetical protein CNMCM7927_002649 [Aspergillus lentulus]GFF78658.1 hypothetical protein IFM47457_04713 [Aspergillus lentulus]GFG03989.1 hypothetical protein IFM61392_03089 [Aspergillus lentulus]